MGRPIPAISLIQISWAPISIRVSANFRKYSTVCTFEYVRLRAPCAIIPPSLANIIEFSRFLASLRPSKDLEISVPCFFFTLNINLRTSAGTGFILMPLSPRSNMCVCMPASLNGLVHSRTALLGFSPNRRLICSNPPPLVSTLAKHPISIIGPATLTSWSTLGT